VALALALALAATPLAVASTAAPAGAATRAPKWEISDTVPGGTFSSTTCPSATDCDAVGSSGLLVTTNSGTSWSFYTLPAGTSGLVSIACPTTTSCQVVGYEDEEIGSLPDQRQYQVGVALRVTYSPSGPVWTSESVPVPSGDQVAPDYTGVSCASADNCYIGSTGSIAPGPPAFFATDDGGAVWSAEPLPAGIGEFNALSCPPTPAGTTCYATDISTLQLSVTTNGGLTWTVVPSPKPQSGMSAIACPSATTCFVAGDGGTLVTTDGGATWVLRKVPKGSELLGISCPTTADCMAVGITVKKSGLTEFIGTTVDGGAKWKHVKAPTGADSYILMGASCYATTSCFAVGPWSPNDGSYVLSVGASTPSP
jgi:hypothetical protein